NLSRAKYLGRRVDHVADQGCRFREANRRIDFGGLAGEQNARAGLWLVCLRAIIVEAMLREQPAKSRLTCLAVRQLVRPLRQAPTELGEAPGRKRLRVGNRAHHLKITAARQDDEGEAGLTVEPVRFD